MSYATIRLTLREWAFVLSATGYYNKMEGTIHTRAGIRLSKKIDKIEEKIFAQLNKRVVK